jgi:hypothetical protein
MAPVTMNAFELISTSQGLNLSSLFEKQMVCLNFLLFSVNEAKICKMLEVESLTVCHICWHWDLLNLKLFQGLMVEYSLVLYTRTFII